MNHKTISSQGRPCLSSRLWQKRREVESTGGRTTKPLAHKKTSSLTKPTTERGLENTISELLNWEKNRALGNFPTQILQAQHFLYAILCSNVSPCWVKTRVLFSFLSFFFFFLPLTSAHVNAQDDVQHSHKIYGPELLSAFMNTSAN